MTKKPTFAGLQVAEFLVEKLKTSNITTPTEVQTEAIPLIFEGKDLIGQSPTGTGKTMAYVLPLLTKLNMETKGIQVLILAPTRELAVQITKTVSDLGAGAGIIAVSLLGGVNIQRQLETLKKKPQVVIGTPGRILELIRMRKINAQTIKSIVIDEADKMWELGFKDDAMGIIKATLRDRQIIMVSATVSPEMVSGAMSFLKDPAMVNIAQESRTAETIKHMYFNTQEKNKVDVLLKIMQIHKPKKMIMFINSNKGVIPYAKRLRSLGFDTEGLHSELNPQERKNVLEKFRTNQVKILVTTDLFARGMDIKDVDLVLNFDVPLDSEYYIHRVGRTGRAGKAGLAINFVTPEQKFIMNKYEKLLHIHMIEAGISEDRIIEVKKKKNFTQKANKS